LDTDDSKAHQTLFRGNTIFTKVMELCMNWYGKAFLEASIGSVLRRLCAEKVGIEVDPVRSGKGTKDAEKNLELLIYWCQEFWNQIYSVRNECPPSVSFCFSSREFLDLTTEYNSEMRRLFETVRSLVEKRYRIKDSTPESRELPWQSVSAFCFLRFIVPAILHPHLFGLCPGMFAAHLSYFSSYFVRHAKCCCATQLDLDRKSGPESRESKRG
jgi:hypothetical protein